MIKPLVGCTMGDPAGVGPEILLRAAGEDNGTALLLVGDPEHFDARLQALADEDSREGRLPARLVEVATPEQARAHLHDGDLGPWVLRCCDVRDDLAIGIPAPDDARAALACVQRGADLAATGAVDALATAPLNKDMIAAFEPRFMGHTEYLAARAGIAHPTMIFVGPAPHIALLSTHLPLATALTLIRRDLVSAALERLHEQWAERFGRSPVIGVAAVNPHAGEHGRIGTEESRELSPAIERARQSGVDARGPYPADSIFLRGGLDVVLALYHDQGTIMAKRAAWPTVNMTLGLPYIRTSPDHGTAYDRAGTGTADAAPMLAAIRLAGQLARGPAELCGAAGNDGQ